MSKPPTPPFFLKNKHIVYVLGEVGTEGDVDDSHLLMGSHSLSSYVKRVDEFGQWCLMTELVTPEFVLGLKRDFPLFIIEFIISWIHRPLTIGGCYYLLLHLVGAFSMCNV